MEDENGLVHEIILPLFILSISGTTKLLILGFKCSTMFVFLTLKCSCSPLAQPQFQAFSSLVAIFSLSQKLFKKSLFLKKSLRYGQISQPKSKKTKILVALLCNGCFQTLFLQILKSLNFKISSKPSDSSSKISQNKKK